ncbi:MAG TPA: tetratricopeptide repeat protein [Anaeromyxobacteraceae bacterium]|nr:tetratricopeptide repeat protein [Anaeromyxobacteraceae bacterium]
MGLFSRKPKPFDRTATLALAEAARTSGRRKKAIALYRKVLEADPKDLTVHGKIAPLLAKAGKRDEALASFRAAWEGQFRAGFVDRALAVLRQAVDHFPQEIALWEEIARLHLQRGRRADAVAAMVEAGGRLWRSRQPLGAVKALRRALEIEPWHPEATMMLARALAKDGRIDDALSLLDALGTRVRGRILRRSRRLAFFLSPTPARLWRWLRSALGGR